METMSIGNAGEDSGRIFFGPAIEGLSSCLEGRGPVFLVYDSNVGMHADKVKACVPVVSALALDVSETAKTIRTVMDICSWLLEKGADERAYRDIREDAEDADPTEQARMSISHKFQ